MKIRKNLMGRALGLGMAGFLGMNPFTGDTQAQPEKDPARFSPAAVIADAAGTGVFVAEYLARQVVHVTLADGRVDSVAALDAPPSGLALDAGAGRLYVTLDSPEGKVEILDVASGQRQFSVDVGHFPLSPVLTADGGLLAVCNRFNNNVSLVDTQAKQELIRIPVQREPVAAAFSPDGTWLVVANHLPMMPGNGDYVMPVVSLISPASRSVVTNIMLPSGSTALRGVCVSPDSRFAYVTHSLGRYQLPTTQLERGWMNTSALSIIDLTGTNAPATVLLDDMDLGAANPWGVVCSADGKRLLVAHAGTHEISVIDRLALHERLASVAGGEKAGVSTSLADVPNDLSFLVGIRQRVRLPGNGPRALCIAGDKAVAGMYFSDGLALVALASAMLPAEAVALGSETPLSQARRGEMNFNDAGLCFQQWQSCSTCHPGGRADGLNWDLLNDGIGNPKNVKSLLLSHRTPPVMAEGVRANMEVASEKGFHFILFRQADPAIIADTQEYIRSLTPEPSPWLVGGQLSAKAQRGKEVFEGPEADCARCHPTPLFTDLELHDVGTRDDLDRADSFDTPTCVELWRTAPYLHSGAAVTLTELFTRFNTNDLHGVTSSLSPEDLDALVEYLLSL